jgi:superfamily II DNA helicase RecQ
MFAIFFFSASSTALIRGEDVFVNTPVGSGKSISYVTAAVFRAGVTLVIQPTVALMEEQARWLALLGISVVAIHNNLTLSERDAITSYIHRPNSRCTLIFCTPEKFAFDPNFRQLLMKLYLEQRLSALVLDEAHFCLALGESHRPAYNSLHIFRDLFPNLPLMAATGTVSGRDIARIRSELRMRPDTNVFQSSMYRPNVSLFFMRRQKGFCKQLLATIRNDYGTKPTALWSSVRWERLRCGRSISIAC